METTTIQISKELQKKLEARKLSNNESYDEVIINLFEDTMEISEETKRDIEEARAQIKAGKFYTLAQVKKKLRL